MLHCTKDEFFSGNEATDYFFDGYRPWLQSVQSDHPWPLSDAQRLNRVGLLLSEGHIETQEGLIDRGGKSRRKCVDPRCEGVVELADLA